MPETTPETTPGPEGSERPVDDGAPLVAGAPATPRTAATRGAHSAGARS